MQRETYRGVKLAVKRGREWGYLTYMVNGRKWGDWLGRDEQAAIDSMKRYVDAAAERPEAYPDFVPRESAA